MWDELKGWCAVILSIALGTALVISAVAWPVAWYWKTVNEEYIRAGYEQTILPGQQGVYWVKKGEK